MEHYRAISRPAILLGFLALTISACRLEPKSVGHETRVGWRPIASFSGNGPSQTESFNIESGQWRMKWTATNEKAPGAGTLRVTVHSAVSGRPITVAVDLKGIGHDVSYINEDPRLYHLVIESNDIDWSLAIEEAVVGY
jgi:hypothetical protein